MIWQDGSESAYMACPACGVGVHEDNADFVGDGPDGSPYYRCSECGVVSDGWNEYDIDFDLE